MRGSISLYIYVNKVTTEEKFLTNLNWENISNPEFRKAVSIWFKKLSFQLALRSPGIQDSAYACILSIIAE